MFAEVGEREFQVEPRLLAFQLFLLGAWAIFIAVVIGDTQLLCRLADNAIAKTEPECREVRIVLRFLSILISVIRAQGKQFLWSRSSLLLLDFTCKSSICADLSCLMGNLSLPLLGICSPANLCPSPCLDFTRQGVIFARCNQLS